MAIQQVHTQTEPTLYIGIGASAGGLEALEAFFQSMPADTTFGFVVIQHLSPDYKSLMVELLSKKTQMPVFRAEEGMIVEAGSVYLIPPKKNLTIFHSKLILIDQDNSRGLNLPIDIFFQSLAEDQRDKAVGIILSGTGSDGVRGIRAIKEAGGMVMAQSEESARFDGMPRSAISTGMVDFIMTPTEMPQQLIAFAEHPYVLNNSKTNKIIQDQDELTRIFALLRDKHKIDFTHYKINTINRRIERRMSLYQIASLDDYARLLERHPSEVSTLYKELLIGVTNFFRDPEAFFYIENLLKSHVQETTKNEIRLWVTGCSTGEEAYSIAILCLEALEKTQKAIDVKIFATDIDQDALFHAGNGCYPESIAADLSPIYLSKYFNKRDEGFQVSRALREVVVFAHHNLIKDPPFTNIQLIACRNLLIYLQPVLQNTVLEFFSFSLNQDGILFLGTSETVGDYTDYFELMHHKWKIYRSTGRRRLNFHKNTFSLREPTSTVPMERVGPSSTPMRSHVHDDRMMERLISVLHEHYVPVSVVVNESMQIQRVMGDTTGYLSIPSGKLENHLLQMAHKDLSIPLATGIQKAFKHKEPVRYSNVRIHHSNHSVNIQLRFIPLPNQKNQDPLVAIFFEFPETSEQPLPQEVTYDLDREAQERIQDLEQELQFTKENLQATIEELETSNEELQSTNEELLSSNEELQSTNEELQSVNEELHTVNAEYQNKIFELTELNNDVENLLDSSQVGFLLLDENLDIRKYSAGIRDLFYLSDKDLGRSITNMSNKIKTFQFLEAIQTVLRSKTPQEYEVQNEEGHFYLMRILPYHITPDRYAGLVVTFVNITLVKQMEQSLKASNAFSHSILNSLPYNVAVLDERGTITYVNEAWKQFAMVRKVIIWEKTTLQFVKMPKENGPTMSPKFSLE